VKCNGDKTNTCAAGTACTDACGTGGTRPDAGRP
jgi:hypothetical protein